MIDEEQRAPSLPPVVQVGEQAADQVGVAPGEGFERDALMAAERARSVRGTKLRMTLGMWLCYGTAMGTLLLEDGWSWWVNLYSGERLAEITLFGLIPAGLILATVRLWASDSQMVSGLVGWASGRRDGEGGKQ